MLEVILLTFGTCAAVASARGVVEGMWLGWREGVRVGTKAFCDLVVSLAVMLSFYSFLLRVGFFGG